MTSTHYVEVVYLHLECSQHSQSQHHQKHQPSQRRLTTGSWRCLSLPSKLTITKLVMMISTNLAEDDVLAIEPLGLGGAQEELGAVGVRSSVGHGEHSWGDEGKIRTLFSCSQI